MDPFWLDVSTGAWDETGATGITWNNRPTTVGAQHLVTFANAPAINTVYTSVTAILRSCRARSDRRSRCGLADNSTDNVRLFSREYGTAGLLADR